MLELQDRVIAENGHIGTVTELYEDRRLATVDFDYYPVPIVCISAELRKLSDVDY